MPRNGSGVYSKPAGTTAVTGTTIESAKYNSVVDDLVEDANAARPVVAGGTGATTAAGATTALSAVSYGSAQSLSAAQKNQALANLGIEVFGQCYLRLNSTNLQLIRKNGKLLTIDGGAYEIPSGGITLAPSGLSSATVYYIYAYMNSGTMTLEASATAYEVNSTYGNLTKTGDGTRTFVGFARTSGATAWADDSTTAHVISYFNPKKKKLLSVQTANRAFTNTSLTKINTEFDLFFLVHPDHPVEMKFNGGFFNSAGSLRTSVACGVGSTGYEGGILLQPADTGGYSCSCSAVLDDLSVATAYTGTVFGAISSGTATLQYNAGSPGFRCSLTVTVWG